MSRLLYNGVEIEVLRTLSWQRRNVYDDSQQDVLYQEHTIEILGVLNPQATSYIGPGAPTLAKGRAPAVTDAAIRHYLMEQRKQLIFLDDTTPGPAVAVRPNVMLQCPAAGDTVDARGGPYPQDFHVLSISGIKTWEVYYKIVCYVKECYTGGTPRSPVISHRWRQHSDLSWDDTSMRVTEGVAVFDMAELTKRLEVPAQYLRDLVHPIPQNFQRMGVKVTQTEDGTRVHYVAVDQEMTHNLNPNLGVKKIEAYHTEHVHQPSPHIAAQKFGKAAIKAAPKLALGGFLGMGLGGIADMTVEGIDILLAAMPICTTHMFIRVWGNRNTPRQALANVAIGLALGRLIFFDPAGRLALLPSLDASLTRDLKGKFVEFQFVLKHPPSQVSVAAFAGSVLNALQDNETLMDGFLNFGLVYVRDGNGTNPAPPNSNNTRGTWTGTLVAQALESACRVPSAPFNRELFDKTVRS